jgi:protoporphyrin/coproporphyrin ferrochelatase
MTAYTGLPEYEHASPSRLGVLMVNLGTPQAPTRGAVRKFLAEFLSDPRVIEMPRWLWLPLLHGIILQVRPPRSAHAYQQIWTAEGSPLLHHCRQLAMQAGKQLAVQFGDSVRVELGMTYGQPSISNALDALRRAGMRRLLVLPLFPQYSATSTGSVFDRVSDALKRWRWVPEFRFITSYHDQPSYIAAVSAAIEHHWTSHPRHHLLFSFHGLPQRYMLDGDPYYCQCVKSARLITERLGLQREQWSFAFQSQVGRQEWLRPYTDQLLMQYAASDRKQVTVVCPGFAVDNLETLEEIALRNRAVFLESGGQAYDYVPALNASAAHVDLLCELVVRQLQGWPEAAVPTVQPDTQAIKQRALLAGAAR